MTSVSVARDVPLGPDPAEAVAEAAWAEVRGHVADLVRRVGRGRLRIAFTMSYQPPSRPAEGAVDLDRVVRDFSHDGLGDDSLRFVLEQLLLAHQAAPNGPTLEVGTYKAGTSVAMLHVLAQSYRTAPPYLVTVDPYGGKPYRGGDVQVVPQAYEDQIYTIAKQVLSGDSNHAHFTMTGVQFLRRCVGTTYWRYGVERMLDRFTFAFLDGDHDYATVTEEVELLLPVMASRGRIVIDNVDKDPRLTDYLHAIGARIETDRLPGGQQALLVAP